MKSRVKSLYYLACFVLVLVLMFTNTILPALAATQTEGKTMWDNEIIDGSKLSAELKDLLYKSDSALGYAMEISYDNRVVFKDYDGNQYREESSNSRDVTKDSIFSIASVTKAVFAVMMYKLEEMYPSYNVKTTPIKNYDSRFTYGDITAWNVITHSTGFDSEPGWDGTYDGLDEYLGRYLTETTKAYETGTKTHYLNSYILLYPVIAKLYSGNMSLAPEKYADEVEKFAQEIIFEPCKMTSTTTDDRKVDKSRLILHNIYTASSDNVLDFNRVGPANGSTGLLTTAGDLMNFTLMICNGGKFESTQVINAETIAKTMEKVDKFGRANAFWINDNPLISSFSEFSSYETYGHPGSSGASVFIDMKNKITGVFLSPFPGVVKDDYLKIKEAYNLAYANFKNASPAVKGIPAQIPGSKMLDKKGHYKTLSGENGWVYYKEWQNAKFSDYDYLTLDFYIDDLSYKTENLGLRAVIISEGGKALQYTFNDQVIKGNDYNSIKLELPKDGNITNIPGYFVHDPLFNISKAYRVEIKLFDVNSASPEHTYRTVNIALLSKKPVLMTKLEAASPAKTEYTKGEKLDLTGMEVTATYSDGTSSKVTDYTVDPKNGTALNDLGNNTITVAYSQDGVTKTATFSICVKETSEETIKPGDEESIAVDKLYEQWVALIKNLPRTADNRFDTDKFTVEQKEAVSEFLAVYRQLTNKQKAAFLTKAGIMESDLNNLIANGKIPKTGNALPALFVLMPMVAAVIIVSSKRKTTT